MTTPTPDPMDELYRRASAEEAGAPSSATREAIRARAAAVAAQAKASKALPRGAAANDGRYWMRAVAGVAVLGVGVLLWRQVDHRMPGETPLVQAEGVAESAADVGVRVDVPPATAKGEARQEDVQAERAAPPAVVAASAPQARDVLPEGRVPAPAEAPAAPAAVAMAPVALAPSPPPPPPALQESFRTARERSAASAAMPMAIDDALAQQVQQQLPQAWQSATPREVWLVRGADGAVLASGEGVRDLEAVAVRVRALPALQGRALGPWSGRALPNAQGQLLQVYEARAR